MDDKGAHVKTSKVADTKKCKGADVTTSKEAVTKKLKGANVKKDKFDDVNKARVRQTASVRRKNEEFAKVYKKRSRQNKVVAKESNIETIPQDNNEAGEQSTIVNVDCTLEGSNKGVIDEQIVGEEVPGGKDDVTKEGSIVEVGGQAENMEVTDIVGSENGLPDLDGEDGGSRKDKEVDDESRKENEVDGDAEGRKDKEVDDESRKENEVDGDAEGRKDNDGDGDGKSGKDNDGDGKSRQDNDGGDGKEQSVENEDDDEDEGGNADEGLKELRDEVKGILSNSKLYRSFNSHVASQLLKKTVVDRRPLTCKQHTKKLKKWDLENEHASVVQLVKNSPLYCLMKCSYPTANRVIISGFVERWHAETNTFHTSGGEVTITLDDVAKIIGLPITGNNLTGKFHSSDKDEDLEKFVERVLGIPAEEVAAEFVLCKSKCVRYDFLSKQLKGKAPETYTAEQVARGFLLYLLSCTIFQDKTGDKVHIKYLYYLEEWESIGKWAWGAAALAYLYRELGKASRVGTKTISGYLTLLEAWVYEHFPAHRPHKSIKLTPQMSRTAQWKPRTHYNAHDASKQLHHLMIKLDGLTKNDVVWTPYR